MLIQYKLLIQFRASYEDEKKVKQTSSTEQKGYMAGNAEVYDLANSLIMSRAPTNPNAVMEFLVDCYTAMWQNILRNGRAAFQNTFLYS